MKRYLIIFFACVMSHLLIAQDAMPFFDPNKVEEEEAYQFKVEYRVEAGFTQHWQHSLKKNKADMYLNGARLGMTFDFMLPKRFSVQTGLLYTITYGTNSQCFGISDAEESYARGDNLTNRVTEHWFAIPVRAYYNIHVWKKLNLMLYTGPQLMIGLAEYNNVKNNMPPQQTTFCQSINIHTEPYDRFREKELYPVNIQWGVGMGIEWDCFRLYGGYDFGLNNQVRNKVVSDQHLWEWSWYVSFAYKLPIK